MVTPEHDLLQTEVIDLPLFPLNLVLFPGQVQQLHIFEPRYREMINYCIDHNHPFGIVLIKESENVAGKTVPYNIGTAAQIKAVQRLDDGRMVITTLGTNRFYIDKLNYERSYLMADVRTYPVSNGSTQKAAKMGQKLRPRVVEYVDKIALASNSQLSLKSLPDDPTSLAFLIAMALQINNVEKQKLLSMPTVPDILQRENYLLWREIALLQHQIDTQRAVFEMTDGPTGYVFPN